MLATQKATRGFIVKVNRYNDYQTLDNYKKPQEKESERNTEGTQKEHESHTINKYDNNVNNDKNDKRDALRSQIIEYLNKVTHSKYKSNTPVSVKHINARLKEGFVLEDFKYVIDVKWTEWGGKFTKEGKSMEDWMRPITLFGPKFEGYLNQEKPNSFDKYLKKE